MSKYFLTVFVLFVLSTFTAWGETKKPKESTKQHSGFVDRLHAKLDLTYAKHEDRSLEMDVYRPKGVWGELPAIVCIHGGGWAKGNRTSHAKIAQALAARGYVAVTISYRLSGEASFPAAIQDCKSAVRFLRANAKEFGIDVDKIGAIGLSAGGHLTALPLEKLFLDEDTEWISTLFKKIEAIDGVLEAD
jgi:arylsulfatase A